MIEKIIKYLIIIVLSLVVLLAAAISLARYFMPSLDQYERQITEIIAKELQLNVHFATFEGDWYRFGPALKITDMVLSTPDGKIVTEVDALYVSVNILASLAQRQLVPAYLSVIGLQLDLQQQPDKQITIPNFPGTVDTDKQKLFIDALKKYNRVTLRRSQINFKDEAGVETPIYVRRMVLSRSGQNHQLDLMLNLLNHPTRLEMVTTINGDLSQIEKLAINGYIKLDDLILDGYLKPYLFKGYGLREGVADLHAWFDWRDHQLQSLHADVNLQQLHIYEQAKDIVLKPFDLQSEFLYQHEGEDAWSFASNDLRIGLEAAELVPIATKFKLSHTSQENQLVAEKIMLENVAQTLVWSDRLTQEQHDLLTSLSPRGTLDDVKITLQDQDWQMGLGFNDLSFQSTDNNPGIENMSGKLIANPRSAQLTLASTDTQFDYPAAFAQPLFFNKIEGEINGQYDGQIWQVATKQLRLLNDELTATTDFTVKGAKGLDTLVDVNLVVPELNSLNLYHYLPTAAFSTELSDWLKVSFGSGKIKELNLKVEGPVSEFPYYDQGDGLFRLHLFMEDFNLKFQPDWPPIEKASGEFLFTGRHMDIVLHDAQIFNTPLLGVAADISLPSIGTSWLTVHGEALMSVQHAIDFIHATPMSDTLGKSLNAFTFNVPATLTLDLKIPLDNEAEETKVNGLVQISEGDVVVNDLDLKFTDINGILGFTENNINSEGIHTQLFGRPALLTMTPELKGTHHLTNWKLSGSATIADMAAQFPSNLWDYVKGETNFVAGFVIDNDTNENGFDLVLGSDLVGVELSLPAPLGKTKDQAQTMRYTHSIGKPNETIRIEYAKLIDVVAQLKTQADKTVFYGAKIKLGSSNTNLEVTEGINVTGTLPSFSYDIWEDFIESTNTETAAEHEPPIYDDILGKIKLVDVTIKDLIAFHYPFFNAHVVLTQAKNKWMIDLNSDDLKGKITIPQNSTAGVLTFNLDYCNWRNAQHAEEKNALDPRQIPAVSFSCRSFVYNQKNFGTIKFTTTPEITGLKIKQIEMLGPQEKFTGNGRWWVEGDKQKTELIGHLSSNALDKTLMLADVSSSILKSKTEADFNFIWPGDPFDFALAHLSGSVDIHLKDGVLVDVNPGFGRILSLLSLDSIERRLRLDFSDVFKKGFSFDDITTHISIKDGIAHTDNLSMKAPAAEIKMQGNVNLGTKQLDLFAQVTTHITSSLPIAATIASGGNPIVGAVGLGIWAADKIVKSTAGDVLGSSYRVTGTWEKPIVNGK
ncbi:MAG: YhdP family protein [Legionellales bacterium]|jgi:uncharacterized protein (TIGR02099 family)